MTTIIVKPIDMSAPGSFRQRQKMMKAVAMIQGDVDQAKAAEAYLLIEQIVLARCETDDGTPLEDALDEISAEGFDELIQAISGESAVPTTSAES